jgi:arsenate reductase (thioredoxin)
VLTVCDSAAGEVCPVWPGHPSIAHWGIEDPAAVEGSDADKEQAFLRAFQFLKSRIGTFLHLSLVSLDRFTMGTRLQAVGHVEEEGMTPSSGNDLHQR